MKLDIQAQKNKIHMPILPVGKRQTLPLCFIQQHLRPVTLKKHPFIHEISPKLHNTLAFKFSQTCDTSLYHCHENSVAK